MFVILVLLMVPAYIIMSNNEVDIASNDDKFIGSNYGGFYKIPIDNFDFILANSDLIVIGEVIDDGTEQNVDIYGMTEDEKEAFKQKFGKLPTDTVTYSKFKVTETINGELNEEIITIRQNGAPGSDYGETKIKKNQNMLLILSEVEEGIYIIPCLESGAFVISDDKVKSNGNDKAILQFENQKLDKLVNEIKKYYKKNNE